MLNYPPTPKYLLFTFFLEKEKTVSTYFWKRDVRVYFKCHERECFKTLLLEFRISWVSPCYSRVETYFSTCVLFSFGTHLGGIAIEIRLLFAKPIVYNFAIPRLNQTVNPPNNRNLQDHTLVFTMQLGVSSIRLCILELKGQFWILKFTALRTIALYYFGDITLYWKINKFTYLKLSLRVPCIFLNSAIKQFSRCFLVTSHFQ